MSVAALVYFKSPDREMLYVPVATAAAYSHFWVTAAKKLGLPWLPEFQTGSDVPLEDLPAVIAEIEQVRAEFARRPKAEADWLLERVDFILEALRGLDLAEVEEIFIG